jgi:hypothetical protein
VPTLAQKINEARLMDAYYPLIDVAVLHSYFDGGACRHLEFVPTPETLKVLQRNHLMLRRTAQGMVVLAKGLNVDVPVHASDNAVSSLRFAVLCTDPAYWTYTAGYEALGPHAPLYFSDQLLAADGHTLQAQALPAELTPAYWRSIFSGMQLKKPCIVIELHFSDKDLYSKSERTAVSASARKNYQVFLKAREVNWKYYFWGECAKKAIEIVDLNKATKGIGFESSLMPVAKGGVAWVSTKEIPMQEVPTQRFQLREVQGETEGAQRVLVKRLPNAGITKFGRELLRDGVEVLVAEIYINQ